MTRPACAAVTLARVFSARRFSLVALVLLACLPACGSSDQHVQSGGTAGPSQLVSGASGVGSVRLGGSAASLSAAFGRPSEEADGLPVEAVYERVGAPGNYVPPETCNGVRGLAPKTRSFSFSGVGAEACDGRVYLLVVTSRGSRTTAGARIGQPLAQGAARHRDLKCADSTGRTTERAVPVYRYCTGRLASGHYLWLGQDPISSIAISNVPLG